jgi:hypothetical protein
MTEFETLVEKMRQAQKQYFRTKIKHDLKVSIEYERRVDEHLRKLVKTPPPRVPEKQFDLLF